MKQLQLDQLDDGDDAASRPPPSYVRIIPARPMGARRVVAAKVATFAACVVLTVEAAWWTWGPWCLIPAGVVGAVAGGVVYWLPSLVRRWRAVASQR